MDIFSSRGGGSTTGSEGIARIPLTEDEKKMFAKGTKPPRVEEITWRIFRIMAEFVDGFQFLSATKRQISVFGSSRFPEGSKWCVEAEKLGHMLGKAGFSIVTGGGPGIMEGANKGAYEAGAVSIGLNIQLPREQRINPFVTRAIAFHYFFTRKVMLAASAQAYVYFPGGYGTLDELFEILTLIQTGKSEKLPVVLIGSEYWGPLKNWIKETVYGTYDAIDRADVDLLKIVDSAEEAYAIVSKSSERHFF